MRAAFEKLTKCTYKKRLCAPPFKSENYFFMPKALLYISSRCRWSPVSLVPGCGCSWQRHLAVTWPGQRGALGWLCLAAGTDNFLLQFIYSDLALQVRDLDVGPVTAQSQQRLGLKHRLLMMFPPPSVWRCLPLLKPHSMAWLSLPPEAQKDPPGETVTVQVPVRPMWLVFSLQFTGFHTLTKLSQPQDRMMGLRLLGKKHTQNTHSKWLSSWTVYLHTPEYSRAWWFYLGSQRRSASCQRRRPQSTHPWYSLQNQSVVVLVVMSQKQRAPPQEPGRTNWPSEEMSMSLTKWEWTQIAHCGVL